MMTRGLFMLALLSSTAVAQTYPSPTYQGLTLQSEPTADNQATRRSYIDHIAMTVRNWGAACDGITDDSVAMAAAATALRDTGRSVLIPGDCRVRMGTAAQAWLRGMKLVGPGVQENGGTGPGVYGQHGGTILIDRLDVSPFVVSDDWSIDGVEFFWPQQTEAAAVARGNVVAIYPALISIHGSDRAQNWSFTRNQVVNAYDLFDLTGSALYSGTGHFRVEDNQILALHYAFKLNSVGGESWITNNQFTPAAFLPGVLGTNTTNLRTFLQSNSTVLYLTGNGTSTAVSTASVDGMTFANNIVFMARYAMHVVGGNFNIGAWSGGLMDQVQTPLAVDSGGSVQALTITGGTWLCQRLGDGGAVSPCVTLAGGAPGSSLTLSGVDMGVSAGAGIVFRDPGAGTLNVVGGRMAAVGNISVGNPFAGVDYSSAGGTLTVSSLPILTLASANQLLGQGIIIAGTPKSSVVSSVILGGWNVPVVNNATAGSHAVVGSSSYSSTAAVGQAAIAGPGAALTVQAGNRWDIGGQRLSLFAPNGQDAGLRCSGVATSVGCVIETQGGGGVSVNSGLGTLLALGPTGGTTQTGYPVLQSAAAGGSVIYSASSGNVSLSAAANGSLFLSSPTMTGTVTIPAGASIAGYATLVSPGLTGLPTAPTAATDTSTGQLATTAFVTSQAATSLPLAAGSGSVGISTRFARADHAHPIDTSRAPTASPSFTGTVTIPAGAVISGYAPSTSPALSGVPTAPTAAAGTSTAQIASTAFVTAAMQPSVFTTLTASGSYSVPAWAKTCDFTVIAGGGSGANGATAATGTALSGGAGGTGGNINQQLGVACTPGSVLAVTVGFGGTVPSGAGAAGTIGAASSIVGTGLSITAYPGGASSGGSTVASASGGSGGMRSAGGSANGATSGSAGGGLGYAGASGTTGTASSIQGFAAAGGGTAIGSAGAQGGFAVNAASGGGSGGGVSSGGVGQAGGIALAWNAGQTLGGVAPGGTPSASTGTLYPNGGAGGAGGDVTHAGGNGGAGYGPGAPGGGGGSAITGMAFGLGAAGNAGQVNIIAHP